MESFTKFRRQIVKYIIIVAAIMELSSLIFHGVDSKFLLGLIAGTAVTVVNFTILELSAVKLMETRSSGPVVAGYFIRLPIYGVVFYFCIRAGISSAISCGLGFVTLPLALMYLYGIKSRFPGAEKNPLNDWTEPKEWNQWDEDDDEDDDWNTFPKWTENKKKKL